jgi:hypothetical protein
MISMASVPPDDDSARSRLDDVDLETLRDAFVEAFNARDLDAIFDLVSDNVETDRTGEGRDLLAEELQAIWERSPGVLLTRALLDGRPSAVAWLPDESGRWSRSTLVSFDDEQGRLVLIEMPDDADALERAVTEDPSGEPLEEEQDWAEWDRGESSTDTDWGWDEHPIIRT